MVTGLSLVRESAADIARSADTTAVRRIPLHRVADVATHTLSVVTSSIARPDPDGARGPLGQTQRRWLPWLAGALLAAAGVVAGLTYDPATISAGVVCGLLAGALLVGSRLRRWIPVIATVAAGVTLLTTLVSVLTGARSQAGFELIEYGALLWLLILLIRLAPMRTGRGIGTLLGLAAISQILRGFAGTDTLSLVAGVISWLIGVAAAVMGGLYLRLLDARRAQAVVSARQTQRLELAHDLHDFVAHDVTGIVVQAQAAQVVANQDPQAVITALRRIEEAGLHSLSVLDRTVGVLRTGDAPRLPADRPETPEQEPGLAELPELVDRFARTGSIPVDLRLPDDLAATVSPEGGALLHRVVVEALTNVRRHATSAAEVRVQVTRTDAGAELSVINDGVLGDPADHPGGHGDCGRTTDTAGAALGAGRAGGGTGLFALADRVAALGGQFTAGPTEDGRRWQVLVDLPARTDDQTDEPDEAT